MPDLYGSTAQDPAVSPGTVKDVQKLSGRLNSMSGTVALASGLLVGQKIFLGAAPSNSVVASIGTLDFDAFGTAVTLDLGGDIAVLAGSADKLIADVDVSAAGATTTMTAVAIEDREKFLWEILGYTEDPGGLLDIVVTIAGATTPNAADLSWEFIFAER